MKFAIISASIALASLAASPSGALAAEASASAAAPSVASVAKPPFVSPRFRVPTTAQTRQFKVMPLGPALVKIDFAAYMSSVEHLQKTFTRSADWPREGITDAEALVDMQTEQARFKARTSFAYSVLTPDGKRERGCIYVSRSPVAGYDAQVLIWVTKAEYDAGFDAELYAWAKRWIKTNWHFKNVAYPGRAIDWAKWDALVVKGTD